MHVLTRNTRLTAVLFAAALAFALMTALQAQRALVAPAIPLTEPHIQPMDVQAPVVPAVPAQPAAPATLAPGVAPVEREAAPAQPATETGERSNPNAKTAAPAVPSTAPTSNAPAPTTPPAPPAEQPKAAPADGRPIGDHDAPPLPIRVGWKGGFDY